MKAYNFVSLIKLIKLGLDAKGIPSLDPGVSIVMDGKIIPDR